MRFSLVFVVLFVAGCAPPAATCSPSSCTGCCDAQGVCQTGALATACGIGGAACNTCSLAQQCAAGFCTVVSNVGGGGGSSGCGPNTCAGCCDTSGFCQTGSASSACGTNGAMCTGCASGLSCSSGLCVVGSGGGGGATGGGGGATGGGAATGGGGAATGGGGGSTTTPLRVFQTAVDFRGNLTTLAGVPGVRAGDVLCQRVAEAEGLSGTWVAALTADAGVVTERFTADGPWVSTGADGGVAFNNAASVRISAPLVPLAWDERGSSTGGRNAWTGRGQNFSNQRLACTGWSSRLNAQEGGTGYPASTNSTSWVDFGSSQCDESEGLLCFEQARTLPDGGTQSAPPRMATKRVFRTSATFNGNLVAAGGTSPAGAAADALCAMAATAGALGGTWKAYLSSPGTRAADRLTFGGPWRLVGGDGGVAVDSVEQLTLGRLRQTLARDELGRETTTYGVWTGTYTGGEIADETCSGWTVSTSGTRGVYGTSNRDSSGWQDFLDTGCTSTNGLYCFEM